MSTEKESMSNFIDEVSNAINTNGVRSEDISSLKNISLDHKECFYLLDFAKNKIICSKGFKNVLGFCDGLIDLDFILNNHHPDDSEMVNRVSKEAILYCFNNPFHVLNNVLFISYRRKKEDGTYIKVLSESSIFEINDQGVPTKSFAKITDISFMDTPEIVCWSFQANGLDKDAFRKRVYGTDTDFFTEREKDIIKEIEKGNTNGSISNNLSISKHTVATHRKNIFKKSNRNNTHDLILFCKRKGII